MKFKKTIITNMVIWGIMVIDSFYVMYAKPQYFESPNINNGILYSKILIGEAILLFIILLCIERFLFRRSRVKKFFIDTPFRLIVPLYIMTIIGTAFSQASIIWGNESFKAVGDNVFIYVLYGIGILFAIYYFPWSWRLSIFEKQGEQKH